MNAVEIEQAITDLAEQHFDAAEFPYLFLEAFGNKATTIKKLRNAAIKEMDAKPEGVGKPKTPKFDKDHEGTEPKESNFDNDNGVANYPGQNSPHVGNGSGGAR